MLAPNNTSGRSSAAFSARTRSQRRSTPLLVPDAGGIGYDGVAVQRKVREEDFGSEFHADPGERPQRARVAAGAVDAENTNRRVWNHGPCDVDGVAVPLPPRRGRRRHVVGVPVGHKLRVIGAGHLHNSRYRRRG